MQPNNLSQIRLEEIESGLLRVIVKTHSYIAGEIHLPSRKFFAQPRTYKNVMYLYHSEGGIGICTDIIMLDTYDIILQKFNSQILQTTRLKFLHKGVRSKYVGSNIDSQIILGLKNFNMTDSQKYEPTESQVELFTEVASWVMTELFTRATGSIQSRKNLFVILP